MIKFMYRFFDIVPWMFLFWVSYNPEISHYLISVAAMIRISGFLIVGYYVDYKDNEK